MNVDFASMNDVRQYSNAMLAGMQAAYGEGFLSPGAAADMRRLLHPVDVGGKSVLDLGCGVGGATLMFAGELGAGSVTAADPEPEALVQTKTRVEAGGFASRVTAVQIEPGSLPFPDESFDIIYSKDVICHIDDKAVLFRDLYRLLAPGGVVVLGDWTVGDAAAGAEAFQTWREQLAAGGLVFYFEPGRAYEQALSEAGFSEIAIDDVSPVFLAGAEEELAKLKDIEALRAALGEEGAARRIALTEVRHEALSRGGLSYCHIRARQ